MHADRNHLPKSEMCANVEAGPVLPSPGPIFAIQVATEPAAESRGNPHPVIIMVPKPKIKKYVETNAKTLVTMGVGTARLLSLIGIIALGCISLFNS